jgi:catechol 2,3-dioxygenase-like lactoylglutathione lyase family enzyme
MRVQSGVSACADGKVSDGRPFARPCNEAAIDPLLIMGWKTGRFIGRGSRWKGTIMLKDKSTSAIVAVSAIDRARAFYQDTLGLEIVDDSMGDVLVFRTGATSLIVYKSDFSGTNKANAVVWDVCDEIDSITAALKAKGVVFEHYDGMELKGDIHVAGTMKMVWFKDPDGNILHLNNM